MNVLENSNRNGIYTLTDNFIGSTFRTSKGGIIKVVSRSNNQKKIPMYNCVCSICSEDQELFSDGIFEIRKGHLIGWFLETQRLCLKLTMKYMIL